jgi:hypothetical protein
MEIGEGAFRADRRFRDAEPPSRLNLFAKEKEMFVSKRHVLYAAVLLFSLTAVLQAGPDLAGTWLGKTEVPNAGADELTLKLQKTETGYTGRIADSLAIIAPDTEIKDVKIDGAKLTFNFPLADGAIVVCELKIDGDKMTGQWVHPEGDTGAIEFARKKA